MQAGLSLLEEGKRYNAETPVLLQSASLDDSPQLRTSHSSAPAGYTIGRSGCRSGKSCSN